MGGMAFAKGLQLLVGAVVVLVASIGTGVDGSSEVPSLVSLTDGSEAPRRGLKQTIRLMDPSATLPPGSEVGLTYNKLTPLPGSDDAYVVLASWTGRQLSSIPNITLEASWPAEEDGTTFGCVIICFTDNGSKFCSSDAPFVNIGSGSKSAACSDGDQFAVLSKRNPGSWDIYVSGSFKGEVLHQSGGAQPSACVSSSQGCGFIGLVSVTPAFQMSLENFDFIRAANRAADPDSHIGRLSPSVFGVWLSGTVSGGSGTFGGEVNAVGAGNFTLTSGSQPRGFIGHFANREFGFGLSWAQSLSDGRLNSDFPQISNVGDSPDCTVVFADEYKAGSPLFQTSWTPDYIPVPNFNADTGGRPSAVIAGSFQLRAAAGEANVCRNPFAVGAKALLTGWKIADGGKVNVISSRFRDGSDTSAFAFAAITPSESFPSIAAGLYKSDIDRDPETKRIKGSASRDPVIFADQGIDVTAIQGLTYDPYAEAWFFAVQRTPQVCALAAFDSLNQSSIFADLDKRSSCACTLGKFAAKSDISPETGEPQTQVSITGSFGDGCAPKPSGSFAYSYPSLSATIVDPGKVAIALLKIVTENKTIVKKDLILAGSRLSLFPDNPEILESSFGVVEKAVADAVASGKVLDMPSSIERLTSVLIAASATPEFQERAAKTISLLAQAVSQAATSTIEVTSRAAALGAVRDELGASTEVLRTFVTAAKSMADIVASSKTIKFSDEAIDSLIPLLQQAANVKGLDATDLRNEAISVQVRLPAQRLANANTKMQIEEAVTKIQEWVGTASECALNTCGESEIAAASVSAIDGLLDKLKASPAKISPTSAQAMTDLLLTYQADTDPAVVASVATKLSKAIVKNGALTKEGLEETLATLSSMSESLKDNPAAIDGLSQSLTELQKAALATTPGLELSEEAFENTIQIVEMVIEKGDSSASSIEVMDKVPSMIVSGIKTIDQLDSAGSRLASMISMYEEQSRVMVLLEATETLVEEIPKRGSLDVSPELFEQITDIISAGKRPSATAEERNLASTISEKLTTIITDTLGFGGSIALDATLLQKNLYMYYGDPDEQRVLIASLEGVDDIVTKAEQRADVRLRVRVVIPLAKILTRAIEGNLIPATAKATAIKLAQRLPPTATESTIDASIVDQAPAVLRYLAREFPEYKTVVSKVVTEADRIVRAVEADDALRLTENNFQDVVSVLSVGIQNDADAELVWTMVEKLPYIMKKSLSPGKTMQAGAENLQMTLIWSTIQDPPVKGTTAHIISTTKSNATSRIIFPPGVMTAAPHYVVLRHSTAKPPSRRNSTEEDRPLVEAVAQASEGTLSVYLLDPTTMEPVHARRLQQVSQDPQEELTYTFYRRDTYSMPVARKKEDLVNTIDVPQCSRVDSDTDVMLVTDCVPFPRFLPTGFHSLPNPNYKFPPPEDSLEPFWIIRPDSPESEVDCRTVRNLDPYPIRWKSQRLFGEVTFEGTECWFYDKDWDHTSATTVYPERGQNCMWDDLAQVFFGPDCAISLDEDKLELGCLCIKTTGDSWFRRATVSNKITVMKTVNKTSKFDTEQELDTMVTRVFAPIVAVISVGALIILFACFWDVRRRSALLGKFFEARRSFQCQTAMTADGSKSYTQIGNFNLRDHLDEVWRWSLETHVFKVLADDMEHYITLAPSQQALHDFFDCDVVRFCALVGLPMHRVMACIPTSDNLSWYPLNRKRTNVIGWRNQALGTSLAMGFFMNNSLISDQVAEEQIAKQDAYFAGCHPMGMRALIRRWRVMLKRRNVQDYGNGWHAKCRVWKIIWLQRHDGLWDLTEDFLTALGADPELLLGVNCAKVPAQGGKECVMNQVPAALEVLFYGESELRIQLWCTFLAKAFLELAKHAFAEFSGREPDSTPEIPTLPTVLAKDAILFAIKQKNMGQALIADLSEVYCEGTDELVASVENDALQLVRSFNILREERQKAWASGELEFITRETVKERQKRKHKEGADALFSKTDFCVVLTDFKSRVFKRNMSLMVSRGEEMAPSGVVQTWNFITGSLGQIFHALFYWHGTIRIGFSAITDTLIVQERTLVVCTTWLFMLAVLAVMFDNAGAKCCELTRNYYQCGSSEYGSEYCINYDVDQFKSPAGLRYFSNTTELLSGKLSCSALTAQYPPVPTSFEGEAPLTHLDCGLFPNYTRFSHIILASFVVAAIALPLKIILKKIFNARRRMSFSSLWIGSVVKDAMGMVTTSRRAQQDAQLASLKPVENRHAMVGKPLVVIGEKIENKAEKQNKSSGPEKGKAAATAKASPAKEVSRAAPSAAPALPGAGTSGPGDSNLPAQSYQPRTRHQSLILSKRSGRRPPPMLQTHASYI